MVLDVFLWKNDFILSTNKKNNPVKSAGRDI